MLRTASGGGGGGGGTAVATGEAGDTIVCLGGSGDVDDGNGAGDCGGCGDKPLGDAPNANEERSPPLPADPPHRHRNRSRSASCGFSIEVTLSTNLDAVLQITSAIGCMEQTDDINH